MSGGSRKGIRDRSSKRTSTSGTGRSSRRTISDSLQFEVWDSEIFDGWRYWSQKEPSISARIWISSIPGPRQPDLRPVLGIDPGLRMGGFALVLPECGGVRVHALALTRAGSVTPSDSLMHRIGQNIWTMQYMLREGGLKPPSACNLEKPYVRHSSTSTINQFMLFGVLAMECGKIGTLHMPANTTVKMEWIKGSATKQEMVAALLTNAAKTRIINHREVADGVVSKLRNEEAQTITDAIAIACAYKDCDGSVC